MYAPRVCPAGYVCDVTGLERAEQPCPAGHYCMEGTATTATTCGHPTMTSSRLYPSFGHSEMTTTLRRGQAPRGGQLTLGSRNTACWDNSTVDFGLQMSRYPARFWSEAHLLPLADDAPFTPLRGRYCLDDACLRLGDEASVSVTDATFDYSGQGYSLRRPVPCPAGVYCHPGTAFSADLLRQANFTLPQPCSESMYCPEGSTSPTGYGEVPAGYYSPYGIKLPCPAGTFCAYPGQWDPFPCPPGTFNSMVGQLSCTPCPVGYICPGYGRIDPAICPPGFVCSQPGLASPNVLCPAGFFCSNGTMTSDPFRNDTTLRPYPCKPGTYCLAGTGYDRVKPSTPGYAQNCTAGFYCEAGSPSPIGSGLCPRGFVCPTGTAAPIPTPKGTFAEQEGTLEPSNCFPGFYAPTIQTVKCYPCPPGTNCENDDMSDALLCPPGMYRSITETDGITCQGCPQGTWSKQWELRDVQQCIPCPPGVVCPIDGMRNPCSFDDFPTPWMPTYDGAPWFSCSGVAVDGLTTLRYGRLPSTRLDPGMLRNYPRLYWKLNPDGRTFSTTELVEWYVGYDLQPDPRGELYPRDVNDEPSWKKQSQCYKSTQPKGSVVYQRMKDYHGPLFELIYGYRHQGYGNDTYYGYYNVGRLVLAYVAALLIW